MTHSFSSACEAAARQATHSSGHAVRFDKAHRFNAQLGAARFVLDNGLTLVLMPDERAPVFTYQTWFRVGSRDEDPERTGFAHLFEHLMFKGTDTYPTGTFDREMEKRGSQTNAATWVDWTYYTEALASRGDNLETVIAFETDRMVHLRLDEQTFRSELEVVKNERRMAVEDSIAGALSERLFALAYREHPYRWPTIGAMAHLEAASVDELRAFYRAYYAPNNAVVVLAGDVPLDATLAALARGYGPLSAQPIARRARPTEPVQREARSAELVRNVVTPQLVLGYHIPGQRHPDFPAIEILADALVHGESARLYRKLVIETHLATEVHGFVAPFADPGLFEVMVTARPDADPQHIIDLVQGELDRLGEGLSARELQKARNNLEVSVWGDFNDTDGCAEALGHHETNDHDFALAFTREQRLSAIDPHELPRVARTIFAVHNRSSVVAHPVADSLAGPLADDAGA